MRLIDATELEKRSDKEMFEINKYTLRLAPTVDAIPVEWINKYKESQSYDVDTYYGIEDMLDEWRKENESCNCG